MSVLLGSKARGWENVKFIVQKTGHIIDNYSEFYRISQGFITDYGKIAWKFMRIIRIKNIAFCALYATLQLNFIFNDVYSNKYCNFILFKI